MSIHRFIAWRFMLRGTAMGTFSPMTLFAWLAIGVGVGAMSSLLSVMYGFESALKTRVLKAYPHVVVRPRDSSQPLKGYEDWTARLKQVKGVVRVMPFIESEMIAQSTVRTLGAVVWGVPLDDLGRLKDDLLEGHIPSDDSELPELILGSELAHRLGVSPGSRLRILSPLEKGGMMGLVPQSQTFVVAGVYSSGHYEFDQQYLFALLEDTQDMLKWQHAISGWHLWAKDIEEADEVQARVSQKLPPALTAQSWTVFNSALFASLKLEQYAMFSILCLAILVAVMNIVITLMMHVTNKRVNIGILRALGASRTMIRKIFLMQGALLGAVGLFIGAVLTIAFIVYIRYFSHYQLPEIYYDRTLPIEIRPVSLALIYIIAIVMIYFATIYPSQKAASIHPIEAIRE